MYILYYLSYPLDSILMERPLVTLNLMLLNYLTSYTSQMLFLLLMTGLTCPEYFVPGSIDFFSTPRSFTILSL